MTLQEHIDEIMDYFDFEQVRSIMDLLQWRWDFCDGIPEIPDIRRFVRKLITQTWEAAHEHQQGWEIESGGFLVSVVPHKEGENVIVRFVATEYDSNPDPDAVITLAPD